MRINPAIMSSAIGRYDKAIRQQKANPTAELAKDKVELSANAKIYKQLLQEANRSDSVSTEKVHGIMNQIAAGTYKIDVDKIVEKMMKQR